MTLRKEDVTVTTFFIK